ncbi:MAG: hypothetical protein AAF628_03325 [Planctomycetota bacterium]
MPVVVGVLAFVAYLLLGQQTLYGDAPEFLWRLRAGEFSHRAHLAYLPVLQTLRWLCAPLQLTDFEVARLASQLGAALGVGFLSAAGRVLGASRWVAAGAGLLIASNPSVLFFATTVEVHGPYLAFVGVAWWIGAQLVRDVTPGRAVATGLATGTAYLAHATGVLLAAPILAVVWLDRRRSVGTGRRAACIAIALAVHAGYVFGVPRLLALLGAETTNEYAAKWVRDISKHFFADPSAALPVLWREWFWPFAPVSVAWLVGWWSERSRPWAGALLIALAPYMGLCVALLIPVWEFGAYQQPLALLAGLCVAQALRPRWVLVCVAIGLLAGVERIRFEDPAGRTGQYRVGLTELASGREPLLLAGGTFDVEALFVQLPEVDAIVLAAPEFGRADREPAVLDELDRRIEAAWREGRPVFLSAWAFAFLHDARIHQRHPGIATTQRHLVARYQLEQRVVGGFAAVELLPRQ